MITSIEKLVSLFQSSHINILIGSGLSAPFLPTLGNIEKLLEELESDTVLDRDKEIIIRCSILCKYFESVINKNPHIINRATTLPFDTTELELVRKNYELFISQLHWILLKRESPIHNKQLNIFTTNIDLFLESALENLQMEYNDGFIGRINPTFSLSNYNKLYIKKTLHYDNKAEIPVFNLFKVHGSLTWRHQNDGIIYSDLKILESIEECRKKIATTKLIPFDTSNTALSLKDLSTKMKAVSVTSEHIDFLSTYDKLSIVNPSKTKFQQTVLDLNHAELLRVLGNELEKECSILMVFGFSFADEHIREIVIRAANSNPTLLVIVYGYDGDSSKSIGANIAKGKASLKNDNIIYETPHSSSVYDFSAINGLIGGIINKIKNKKKP
jgi:hypothetical protein